MDTVIVIMVLIIAVWYTGRRVYRRLKGAGSCNCESGCAHCDKTVIEPNYQPPDDKGAV